MHERIAASWWPKPSEDQVVRLQGGEAEGMVEEGETVEVEAAEAVDEAKVEAEVEVEAEVRTAVAAAAAACFA